MQQTTLNNILDIIKDFADNHQQINTYATGQFSEVAADNRVQYPLLFVELENSLFRDKTIDLSFNILCGDIVRHDQTNRQEVHSDCLQILSDLRTYLERSTEFVDFVVLPGSPIEPVTMRFNDDISGWIMKLTISITNLKDLCNIPLNPFNAGNYSTEDGTTIFNTNPNFTFSAGNGLSVSNLNNNITYTYTGSTSSGSSNYNFYAGENLSVDVAGNNITYNLTGSTVGSITDIGTLRFVGTEAELADAVKQHENGLTMHIILYNDIGLNNSIDLPKSTTAINPKLEINLGGNCIYDATSTGLPYLIGRKPNNQTEADNVMQSWGLHLYNGTLKGNDLTTVLLDLGATYNSEVHHIKVMNAQYGIWFKFCLMSTIRNCLSNNISVTPFLLDRGDWTGAGISNAQSNHSLIEQCRVFNLLGATSAFSVIDSSGTIIRQCISEGDTPQYHIYWDALASTTVKDGTIQNIHVESQALISGIKVIAADGHVIIDGIYSQHDQILIDVESNPGYPHIYVKNIPYFPGLSELKTNSNRVIWSFEECKFDCTDVAIWNGGITPYYWYQEGFNQHKFINYSDIKFNGLTPVLI